MQVRVVVNKLYKINFKRTWKNFILFLYFAIELFCKHCYIDIVLLLQDFCHCFLIFYKNVSRFFFFLLSWDTFAIKLWREKIYGNIN